MSVPNSVANKDEKKAKAVAALDGLSRKQRWRLANASATMRASVPSWLSVEPMPLRQRQGKTGGGGASITPDRLQGWGEPPFARGPGNEGYEPSFVTPAIIVVQIFLQPHGSGFNNGRQRFAIVGSEMRTEQLKPISTRFTSGLVVTPSDDEVGQVQMNSGNVDLLLNAPLPITEIDQNFADVLCGIEVDRRLRRTAVKWRTLRKQR